MSRIRSAATRRLGGLKRNPRHFAQLLVPAGLLLAGLVSFLFGWKALALGFVSVAVLSLAALIWFRLRKVQTRVDASLRRTAALQEQMRSLAGAVERVHALAAVPAKPPASSLTMSDLLPALALSAGLPPGAAISILELRPAAGRALLVVPDEMAAACASWATGMRPGQWEVVGASGGAQASGAAACRAVVVVDGPGSPDFRGVLDRNFFWWLPKDCDLVLVSGAMTEFVERLQAAHDVELLVGSSEPGRARALVARDRG